MADYLFYSILAQGVSLLLYLVFLKREKHFLFNRIYLLASLLLCLLAPTLHLDFGSQYLPQHKLEISPLLFSPGAEVRPDIQSVELIRQQSIPWVELLYLVYFAGAAFLLLRFLRNLLKMCRLIRDNRAESHRGFKIIAKGEKGNPFSFFRFIFIDREDLLKTSYAEAVLVHEQAHGKQYHSADIILLELISCFYWINPFIWLHKKEVLENHEFLADREVVNSGVDIQAYSAQLIKGNTFLTPPLMSGFSFIKTKNRLTMLHSEKSSKTLMGLKIGIVLSLFTGVFAFSSFSPGPAPEAFVVVVDAGHGGEDPGSLNEKEINLQVSLKLRELSREGKIEIVLIRDNDRSLSLKERIEFIRSSKPDLVLSLHSLVTSDPAVNGMIAYFSPEGAFSKESYDYGKILVSEQLKKITDKGEVRGANFLILRDSPVPSVLLELGYLSNPSDNQRLNDPKQQELLAESLYAALEKIREASVE